MVVAEADAARVDVPGLADAAELRDVDVAAGEQVGAGAAKASGGSLGQDDLVVVAGDAVEAEEPQAVEVDLDRRLERAQVVEVAPR